MMRGQLEQYFQPFRDNTIGCDVIYNFPSGKREIVYADWTASARGYAPIERFLQDEVIPFFANTHTQSTATGTLMTRAYEEARRTVKQHVHASADDVLIFCGSGMTSAVNKLQRLLGLKIADRCKDYLQHGKPPVIDEALRPVVFVTGMEHHSNHISWLETIANVEVIGYDEDGNVDLHHFERLLQQYRHCKNKMAAITACSNVTGIQTPYHRMAVMIHAHGGLCFVDFASAAPYVPIDMHPPENGAHLDAIYFSMHKFLGGPGTPGVLVFNSGMYRHDVPDHPGGGTILYSNPWKVRKYVADIESREDGGTPPVLQAIKAALCVQLKDEMGAENMLQREEELVTIALTRFAAMKNVIVLQGNATKRLGVISFIVRHAHHNLIVRLLNDRFGIQARGGCSCAGTYGHHLLNVGKDWSEEVWRAIQSGDMSAKPGWIRISLHPTMSDSDVAFIMDSIRSTADNFRAWSADYDFDPSVNEYVIRKGNSEADDRVRNWFSPGHLSPQRGALMAKRTA